MSNTIGLPIKHDFKIVNDAYAKTLTHEDKQIDIEIGDEKKPGRFEPQLKSKFYGNECNLSVRYLSDNKSTLPTIEGNKIVWENDDERAEIYQLDGGFEFSVILKHRPDDCDINFSIQHKNLMFAKQLEITQADADELGVTLGEARAGRPENVINSYAVYHSNPNADTKKIEGYRTGKAFHIFRPWAEDANGWRVWCDLNIVEGLIVVSLPEAFRLNATYPVLVDPTFGYSSQGATEVTIGDTGAGASKMFSDAANQLASVAANKSVTKLSMYLRCTSGTGTVEVGLYDLTTLALVGKTTLSFTNTAVELVENTVSLAMTEGEDYVIAYGNTEDSGVVIKGYYDTPGGTQMVRANPESGALPATFVIGSGVSQLYSMFATYGEAAAAPVFSGTIPNYSGARTTPVSIATGPYFDNAESFSVANLPAGAAFNTVTGELTWTSPTNGVYSAIVVTATNGLGSDDSNAFSVTINAQAPVNTDPILNQTGNRTNAITNLDASGYFDFATSYAGTNLPDGLTIASGTGIISGTPTVEGVFSPHVTATNADGSTDSNSFNWTISAPLPIPTVSAVNSGNNLQRSQSIAITGTNFEASQGTGSVEFNSVALTVTAWADASITVTVPDEGFIFGSVHDLVIENNSGYSVTESEQFVPESTHSFVTMGVNYAGFPSDSFMFGESDLSAVVVGDQVMYQLAASPQGTVSVDDQGVAVVSGAGSAGDYTFDYLINDASDLTVSSNDTAIVTLTSSDTDVTAPTFATAPAVSNVGETTLTATATINETGDIFVVVVPSAEATPTPAQVIAGQNAAGGAPSAADSATAETSITAAITGLTNNTSYKVCFAAQDDEGTPNLQASTSVVSATTTATPDITPPTFATGPTVSAVTQSTATINATINETGTIYFVIIRQSEDTPSVAEIISGILEAGDEPITPAAIGSGAALSSYLVNNLAAGIPYKACFAARDSASNAQVTPTLVNFTTSQAGSVRSLSVELVDADGVAVASTVVDWQLQDDWGIVTDSGQDTTDADGVLALTNLTTSPLDAFLIVKDPASANEIGAYPVSVTES